MDRRTSRAHQPHALQEPSEAEQALTVLPSIVEDLRKKFPKAPQKLMEWGLDGAVNLALRHAKQAGQQEVIDYLAGLVKGQDQEESSAPASLGRTLEDR